MQINYIRIQEIVIPDSKDQVGSSQISSLDSVKTPFEYTTVMFEELDITPQGNKPLKDLSSRESTSASNEKKRVWVLRIGIIVLTAFILLQILYYISIVLTFLTPL